ncbi:hypothetical protein K439DRAFT_1617382 [Ramaria rubella]|nr:hypothetical protein K439DRAFT_1617382 [Ramaria rubella]
MACCRPSCKVSTMQNQFIRCDSFHTLQAYVATANSEHSLAESQNRVPKGLARNALGTQKRLYNPMHNISKPISIYIQDIVHAAELLTALGHQPPTTDVVDLILMNLDLSFTIVRTLLTTQTSEPSLATVKKTLTDQEDTKSVLTGVLDSKMSEDAMHAKPWQEDARKNIKEGFKLRFRFRFFERYTFI